MSGGPWMVAAENGAIPGGKVGGVADVIRELPPALARLGLRPRVITPGYGRFHAHPSARHHATLEVPFAGTTETAEVYRLVDLVPSVDTFVIDHPRLAPRDDGRIYHDDEREGPYETDAAKFAFFNAAVAAWLDVTREPPAVVHLHDWHAGLLPAFRSVAPEGSALASTRLVFTIHNLAYQGVRPLANHESSFDAWFYERGIDHELLRDPVYDDCVNFMATAIRLCDGLNTVSPSYAAEILRTPDPAAGFGGGEGLQDLLREADDTGRLHGILNGCDYPAPQPAANWDDVLETVAEQGSLLDWPGGAARLRVWQRSRPETVMLSIGRVVRQKSALFLAPVPGHPTALDAILAGAARRGAGLVTLGNGEPALEEGLVAVAGRHDNFLFLRGFAEALSDPLYTLADLFLMPSSFEPCGISQLLALRAGQPVVAHAVGGLRDTIEDGVTGFLFDGDSPGAQAAQFVATVDDALALIGERPADFAGMRRQAASRRFDWARSARSYIDRLYDADV
ncbi:glycogen synthase [Marinihelvus fidelis]|uniref:starch synthase n=1 Tax=Marinihelvus fidelis TaxID=2613842 RepID=A0A5N0T5Y9_9GAMM|nr:glycogen/starch synthase [Marinihelvus fidelis]KAA9130465.1 glycogen synthase [Marinihelvus fidelis]